MKNRFLSRWSLPGLLLAAAMPLAAQRPLPPGKIDLALPALTARADQVSLVTLDGAALHLGLDFLIQQEHGPSSPDVEVLRRLKGVYVMSLDFAAAVRLRPADLAPIRAQLRPPAWSRIVSVQSRGRGRPAENNEIYLCTGGGGAIQGMAILDVEAHELNIVNIVGPIRPSELAVLGGHLGIPKNLSLHKARAK